MLAAAVTSKIDDGNIKAAVRILASVDKPAADTLETLASRQYKHPHPGVAYNDQPPDNVIHKALQVDEENILLAIRSFSAGSSDGPDGLRPQHNLELVTCREAGAELVMAITAFTNVLLRWKMPRRRRPHPVRRVSHCAAEEVWWNQAHSNRHTCRRLAAKCANSYAIAELADLFSSPSQLGDGVPGGCEAAV